MKQWHKEEPTWAPEYVKSVREQESQTINMESDYGVKIVQNGR